MGPFGMVSRPVVLALLALGVLATASVVRAEDPFIYDPHGVADPFEPHATGAGTIITDQVNFSVAEMSLEGIMGDASGRVAIINGNIVEPGKSVGPYTVQSVEADRVILLKGEETAVLQLPKEE